MLEARDLCIIENDSEPRVLDIRLAEALEFSVSRQIRQLIVRNEGELKRHGNLLYGATNSPGAGRPGTEYYLNEAQALLLCVLSKTSRAADVRTELIKVFLAWRHGRGVPEPAMTHKAMDEMFDQKLAPLHSRIGKIEGNVTFLANRIDDIVPRRDFSKETVQQWVYVIARRYSYDCPCCRKVEVVDKSGCRLSNSNCDHFSGRELTRPDQGWLVCRTCNGRLKDDVEFKTRSRTHFDVFQEYRRELFSWHSGGKSIARSRHSRTVLSKDQRRFDF